MNDLDSLKEKLEKEYNDNKEKNHKLEIKNEIINDTFIESRALKTIAFGFIPLVACSFLSIPLVNMGISQTLVMALSYGVPLITSVSLEHLYDKKVSKKRIQRVTSAKSLEEKINEQVKFEIEKEKLENYNKVIKKEYETCKKENEFINKYSDMYDFKIKNNDEIDIEKCFIDAKEKLDEISKKKVLINKFSFVRDKRTSKMDILLYFMLPSFMLFLMSAMPQVIMSQAGNIQIENALFYLCFFGPFVVGPLIVLKPFLERKELFKKLFNKYNSELGENKIKDSINNDKECIDEIKDYKQQLESAIEAVSVLKFKYDKRMNNNESKREELSQEKVQNYQKEYINEINESFEEEKGHSYTKKLR